MRPANVCLTVLGISSIVPTFLLVNAKLLRAGETTLMPNAAKDVRCVVFTGCSYMYVCLVGEISIGFGSVSFNGHAKVTQVNELSSTSSVSFS